jgi:hypothetical protein
MKLLKRKQSQSKTVETSPSPREKYEEFARENGRLKERVEEALSELDELADAPNGAGKKQATTD